MGENSSLNQGHISVVLCGRLGTQVEEFHRGTDNIQWWDSSLNQGCSSVILCGCLGTQVEEFHRGGIRRVALDVRYSIK